MDKFLIGLGSGLLLALIVFMIMEIKLRSVKSTAKADNDKLKSMLTDRMEIESEGIQCKQIGRGLRVKMKS